MDISIVIGNPPYQENTGGGNGNGASAIYQYFIDMAMDISDRVAMIVNNSWMTKQVKDSDKRLLIHSMSRFGMERIIEYPILEEVFPSARVACSIISLHKGCRKTRYIKILKGKEDCSFDMELSDLDDIVITNEVKYGIASKFRDIESMDQYVQGSYLFGLETNMKDTSGEIGFLKMENQKRVESTIRLEDIPKGREYIDYWKVVCGERIWYEEGSPNNIITSIELVKPNYAVSGSYTILYVTEDKEQAINIEKYFKTKLVAKLIECGSAPSCRCGANRFRFVPIQDFSNSSDINWNTSISDIDKQLYKKYNLSDEEISYIESTIKSKE